MAAATFIHDGLAIDYTPTVDVPAGAVVVQGDLAGVANLDIPADAVGALAVSGVFGVAKNTGAGTVIGTGIKVYWDVTNQVASTVNTNPYLGKAVADAADADTTVRVRLDQ